MKKFLAFVLAAAIIAAGCTGCKKIIKTIFSGFNADAPAIEITLPAIPYAPAGEVALPEYTQEFNLDSTIKANTNNKFGAGDVSSVKVKTVVLTLGNGNQLNNFANFEEVRLLFSSDTKADTVQIGSVTFPDTYAITTTVNPANSPELKPYLNGSELYYRVYGKIRRITTQPLAISVKVTLTIN